MKGNLLHILFWSIILCLSCEHESPQPRQESERTVIVYAVAENSLSYSAVMDSMEMAKAVKDIPSNCNLIVYIDRNQWPTVTVMNSKDGVKLWKRYTRDLDSADSLTMLHTLTELTKAFPSKHYGLVLWSHASGWIPKRKAFGIDNNHNSNYSNSGTELEIPALRGILEQLPHLDFILSDACLMQTVEVAHELRQVTDYLIGSPSEIPGEGAPYDRIMLPMMRGNATEIAEQYYQYFTDRQGVALSVVDCRQMDSLAIATAPLIERFWAGRAEVDVLGVQRYHTFETSAHNPEAQDIRGMMHKLLPDSIYEAWEQVLLRTVVWHKATYSWDSVYPGN
ncbi:MAG: clostripain-related cysteine peptidase, partial [Bacteroidaceae bacterium]|nr:clostripain-related cysteine peptidase [Bacteroidaceae bacterium]